MRTTALCLIVPFCLAATGCYNTYMVPQDEFRKLQSRAAVREDPKLPPELIDKLQNLSENDTVSVTSVENELVGVNRDTRIFVRSAGGRRYPVTPFNFSVVTSQLVASDRDTLLPLSELKAYEVDHLSTGKTAALIAVGAIGAAVLIAFIVQTAGTASYSEPAE
jgi:hypothetical protein